MILVPFGNPVTYGIMSTVAVTMSYGYVRKLVSASMKHGGHDGSAVLHAEVSVEDAISLFATQHSSSD